MDLIYSMRRKPLKCEPPQFDNISDLEITRPLCTISIANIIAFSSPTELTDIDGETWGGHVYVCDMETPWDVHKVTSTDDPVSALVWDEEGKSLLVATTQGNVKVFGQKDFLLNEWICLYSANFPGEHIIKAIFFHNGRRFLISNDKKGDAPITERIQLLRSTPTVKGFGGSSISGALVVCLSGAMWAMWATSGPLGSEGHKRLALAETTREKRAMHCALTLSYKLGSILVACVCPSLVRVWSCTLTDSDIHVQPLPAIHINEPCALTWLYKDDREALLLCGSTISLWTLAERPQPVHKLFSKGSPQGSTTPGGGSKPSNDTFNTLRWQQSAMIPTPNAMCLQVSGWTNAAILTQQALLYLNTEKMQLIAVPFTSLDELPNSGTSPKKIKYNEDNTTRSVCGVCTTSLECGVVVIDTRARLSLYTLKQESPPTPASIQTAVHQLESSLVSGSDCLDLIIALNKAPGCAEAVYERFTEAFQRYPPSFQQYYYNTWLNIRIALFNTKGPWLCSQLRGLWSSICSSLRIDERNDSHLQALLTDDNSDLDKTLLVLESKSDLPLEPAINQLRRPLQRATDLVLAAVALATQQVNGNPDIVLEPGLVNLLRRTVAIIRLTNRSPVADQLHRVLPKLNNITSDVVEEVMSLWTWCVPERCERCGVSANHKQESPFTLDYGIEPESLRYVPERLPPFDNSPPVTMDTMRSMFLGCVFRRCVRCPSLALPMPFPASDARYADACRCGGRWTLVSNN